MRAQQIQRARKSNRLQLLFMILIGIVLVLAIALTAVSVSYFRLKGKTAETGGVPVSQPGAEPAEENVPLETLKQYAQQYNVSTEFLQQFFPDTVIYKDSGGIVYDPIREELPKHSYNWDNLVSVNGQLEYWENDVRAARKGIDVSKYQSDIDWDKVRADGVEYAFIRVGNRGYSTGKLELDKSFQEHIEGALAAGIEVGVYIYSQAVTVEEAVEEAELVLSNISDYDITYPVVFDTEEVLGGGRAHELTQAELTDIAIAFCDKVEDAGHRPMIYANTKWFLARLDMSRLTGYDKWFAQYYKKPYFPYDFQIWQYTATGKVDGIPGDVDINLCFADYGSAAAGQS